MFHRYFFRLFQAVFIMSVFSGVAFAIEAQDKDNPQAYLDFAIEKQKSSPEEANAALKNAYLLTEKQGKPTLAVEILIQQAQMAKWQKDYLLAEKYLMKAQESIAVTHNNEVLVQILNPLSDIQRRLKKYELSMDSVQKALAISRETNKSQLILSSLQTKANLLKELKRYEDSLSAYLLAMRYVSKASTEDRVSLFQNIANAYKRINENESSIRYFKKSLHIFEEQNDTGEIAKTLNDIAGVESKIGSFTPALVHAKRALEISQLNKHEKYQLKSLIILSKIYRKLSSYEDALTYGIDALKIYKKNKDTNGIASAANELGLIYMHLNQNENASNYFSLVIGLPPQEIKKKYRAAALRDLGKLIFQEEADPRGLELSNEAFNLYEKLADKNGVATVQKNIGYIYYKMGNLIESRRAYDTAIELFQVSGDVWNEAATKAHLAMTLVDSDIVKAGDVAVESLLLAIDIDAKYVAESAYSALIDIEEKRENYKKALAYARKKDAIISEIKTEDINKRLAEIYIILDVEKTERELETFKRQKEVISFELAHQENIIELREKEKIIDDLSKQKTALLVGVVLFIIGRVFLKMHYRYILIVAITITVLLYSFSSHSADIIKLTHADSRLDKRSQYTHAVLKQSLESSAEKYGPYEIQLIKGTLASERKIMEVHDGDRINLAMAMASPDWEYLAIPIRIPIRRGIANYRLLTINKYNQKRFEEVNSLKELKRLSVGVYREWTLMDILKSENFNIVEGLTYDSMFRMLNKNRFDFIPRGVNEAYEEIALRQNELKHLMIEPHLALYIPQPYYIFVSPMHPKIAERIEFGLEKMIAEGSLQKMFDQHYGAFIKKADLANRTIIHVGNKFLTKKTPFHRKELWFNFDLETH